MQQTQLKLRPKTAKHLVNIIEPRLHQGKTCTYCVSHRAGQQNHSIEIYGTPKGLTARQCFKIWFESSFEDDTSRHHGHGGDPASCIPWSSSWNSGPQVVACEPLGMPNDSRMRPLSAIGPGHQRVSKSLRACWSPICSSSVLDHAAIIATISCTRHVFTKDPHLPVVVNYLQPSLLRWQVQVHIEVWPRSDRQSSL